MRLMKRILIGLLLLVVLIVLSTYLFLNSSKPHYKGETLLSGLSKDVTVYFDDYGIPHIYAENETDLYYALGYVHAQDRLFQMELLRRVGGGRLAEIFGPDLIATDKFMRTIGINEMAEASAAAYFDDDQEPAQRSALAYLQGINAFLKAGSTPPEFTLLGITKEEFTPADLYRIAGYMGFSFNAAIRTDPLITKIAAQLDDQYLQELILNTTKGNTTIPTYAQDTSTLGDITERALSALNNLPLPLWMGSNSWVIGPSKSRSGYPILANDTHIGFQQPAVWYEAHLNSPGFNFYGNHLAGFPFALVGHNDFCAWGLTIFPNDDMDFYRERSNPENADEVWNKDHWEALDRRSETIRVKGGDNLEFQVRSSRHGPIINDVIAPIDSLESAPVSFFWTYLKFPNKALHMTYQMEHSSSLEEFKSAVALLEAPGLNVTYADKSGNIAWWAAARLIKRPPHVESKLILDGASGNDDPLGWYDFEENPRSENPSSGFVYSANNQPDSAYGIFHPGYYYPGARGERIMEMLNSRNDWDLDGFKEMILDDQSPIYPKIVDQIISQLGPGLSPIETAAQEILEEWTGTHGLEDLGPTVYYRVMYQLQKNLFQDEIGEADFSTYMTTLVARRSLQHVLENDSSVWWDNIETEAVESPTQVITESFQQAIAELAGNFGTDSKEWQWRKVHLLEHQHPVGRQKPFNRLFNVGPAPVGGGDEVINKMDFDKGAQTFAVQSGPAMRILIDLADIENSLSVLPTGQSGHPMSPHYKDQAVLYNQGGFRPQMMDRDMIEQVAPNKLVLKAE